LGSGNGNIGAPTTLTLETGVATQIILADINGDGDHDIVMTSQADGFAYAIGDGAGSVGGFSYIDLGQGEFGLAAGFFDEGTTLDFAVPAIASNDAIIVLGD
ncbi:MAG: hypothetical protein ACN4G0_04800, partial [Polyangiales bacterium]